MNDNKVTIKKIIEFFIILIVLAIWFSGCILISNSYGATGVLLFNLAIILIPLIVLGLVIKKDNNG